MDDDNKTEKAGPEAEQDQKPAERWFGEHRSSLPGVIGLVDTGISWFESFLLAGGVLLMAANTGANVVVRYVFQSSIYFTGELNRILIILITFAGISYAARQGRHIRMSAIFDTLPFKSRKALMIAIAVITAIAMFALCYFSIIYIGDVRTSGRVLPSLSIPVWWIYVWVPVGLFITGVQYVLTAIRNVLAKDIYLSTDVVEGYEETEHEI